MSVAPTLHGIAPVGFSDPKFTLWALLIFLLHHSLLKKFVAFFVEQRPQAVFVDMFAKFHAVHAFVEFCSAVEAVVPSAFVTAKVRIISFRPKKHIIAARSGAAAVIIAIAFYD